MSGSLIPLWTQSFDALAVVDDERRYRRVNEAAEGLLGAPAQQILASRIEDFTPASHLDVLDELWRDLHRRGELRGPYEMVRADGLHGLIEFRAVRNFDAGEHLIVAREVIGLRRGDEAQAPDDRPQLTAREGEILQLVADGGSTRAIADILVVSPGTVKTHLEHVYGKLHVRDRASAVAEGIRRGLIR
jgi:DNA-binding CsgD family transcriptional regulator